MNGIIDGENTISIEAQFTKFPELPTEIRLQIWKEALQLQEGRRVKVRLPKDEEAPSVSSTEFQWAQWTVHMEHSFKRSPTPLPPLFLVCQESREIAQRSIKRYCGTVVFNPHIDTLYLPDEVWNPRIKRAVLGQIKHEHGLDDIRYIAADLTIWHGHMSRMWRRLRNFKNLERVFLVAPKLDQHHKDMFHQFEKRLRSMIAQQSYRIRVTENHGTRRLPSPSALEMVGLDWLKG